MEENQENRTYTMRQENELEAEEAGVPWVLVTYDHYDRAVTEKYYGADGTPVEGPEGACQVEREYTSRNQLAEIRYLDAEGNGAAVNGVYGIQWTYNAFGNLEQQTWLGADGAPALNEEGYAGILYDYDLSNATSAEKYWQYYQDENLNPTQARNGAWGRLEVYYPVTRIHTVTYLGEDEAPVMTSDGYAILEYEQDEDGNMTYEGYYDTIKAPINCAEGYASVERGYDGSGRLISERYLDRYNKLTNNRDGVAGWNGYYDDEGNLVVTSRYDQDRNALPADEAGEAEEFEDGEEAEFEEMDDAA